jgi:glutamate-1-semialdehyde 2,1-aminomutase
MGLVPPADGYLDDLRSRCTNNGALLVCDEVITGFRVGPGGAQERFGITPDLSIFGKVVGGGLPLAAIGGPAWLMDELAPLGPVYQAGTLSGNPLATAAGLAVLAQLDAGVYDALEATASRLADGLGRAFADADVTAQVTRAFTLVGVFFAPAPVRNYEDARAADHSRYAGVFHGLLDQGVYFAPSGYETLFPSLAHTDADIDRTIEAAAKSVIRT